MWHEKLSDAMEAAQDLRRPILSLRMLGRLDEELSCANSRFFRTTLYPDSRVAALLRERFVLHWHSVRPVPVVTIDFGDGRELVRTVTGNSAHLVLDGSGRPLDALPGLFDAPAFVQLLEDAADLAAGMPRPAKVTAWHKARLRPPPLPGTDWARLAAGRAGTSLPSDRSQIVRRFPSAREAGELAATKRMVERPILDVLEPLARTLAEDTLRNELDLHRRVHARFATGLVESAESLSDWIYEELFLMPADDPWLGLNPPNVYSALPERLAASITKR